VRVVPATRVPPASLAVIAHRVDARIACLLDRELERWGATDPGLIEPLAALRDLVLVGGKRLRPAFCHWAFVGGGGLSHDPVAVDAGAALEMLHTFALIHDDIMDGSSTRRGTDTIHVLFEERHALSGWRGDGRRFGEGVAILVGDLAFVYADQLLRDASADAHDVWTELRVELNIGQYLDMVGTVSGSTDHATAQRIARYKSGKYTVERPLHLGAALAGRLGDLQEPLSAYGLPLGDAFQLRDDVLGAFGDADVTGKPVGDDLREGKPTLLLSYATELADDRQRAVLALVGRPDLTASQVEAVQDVLVATGAVRAVEAEIEALADEALAALDKADLAAGARAELEELARYVAWRDR